MPGRHLYILQSKVTGALKIGRSDNPQGRLRQLQVGCPYTLRILLIIPDMGDEERRVHEVMAPHRTRWVNGEWFHERGIGDLPSRIWEKVEPWYHEDPDWWKRP